MGRTQPFFSRLNWYFLRVTVRHKRCSASGTKLNARSRATSHFTRRSASGKSLLRPRRPRSSWLVLRIVKELRCKITRVVVRARTVSGHIWSRRAASATRATERALRLQLFPTQWDSDAFWRWELSGMNPLVLRQQMGHSSAVMTARYTGEIPPDKVQDAFSKMESENKVIGKRPRCTCSSLVVYNQQTRGMSGRRTMAV